MICINCRFVTQRLTGVQRFAYELSIRLKSYYGDSIVFLSPQNIIQKEMAQSLNVKVIGKLNGYAWEQFELPIWLKKHNSPPLLNFCSVAPLFYGNCYTTVHDITFERFPATYNWKFRYLYKFLIPILCQKAKKVMTVSEFSKKEIASYYKIPESKLIVIYNATNNSFKPIQEDKLTEARYFLAVSSVKANKNFTEVLKAFEEYQKDYPDVSLFVIGDITDKNFTHINIDSFLNNSQITFLGRVSDEELIKYYSNALGFLFPSIYEGFGIPVIEAQACGCPVISCNSSSLPEVLLNSALFYDRGDIKRLVEFMRLLTEDDNLRNNLINKGFKNCSRFSWEESASKVIKMIETE